LTFEETRLTAVSDTNDAMELAAEMTTAVELSESLARMPFRLSDARSFKEILLLSVTDELDELVV
jgi:hypothetical protein